MIIATRLRSRKVAGLLSVVLTVACASKEARVNTALTRAGVGPAIARCMAGQMADRLSTSQLRRLGDLGSLRSETLATLPLDEFLEKVRALRDAETLAVVTLSAGACRLLQDTATGVSRAGSRD